MKKIIALILLSFSLQSQTLIKLKQLENAPVGSVITTTGTGVPTWTTASSLYPTLQQVLTAGSAITGVNNITGSGTAILNFGTSSNQLDRFLVYSDTYNELIAYDGSPISSAIYNDINEIEFNAGGSVSPSRFHIYGVAQTIAGNGSDNCFELTDDISSKGLTGTNYYGANYTDNTYTQKKYITSNYMPIVGTVNHNRSSLKDWDAQVAKIQQGTASSTATAVWIGDSWTVLNIITEPATAMLRTRFGDAGTGYYGAANINKGNTFGTDGYYTTITRTAGWANVTFSTQINNYYVRSAAVAADSSSTVGDSIYYVGKATDFVVHYMKKTSGGSFVTRIDGASPSTVTTAGTTTLAFSSITGLTDATHTLSIKVASAGSGVLISGVEINRNVNGVRVHNLGASGATSGDFAAQDATSWQDAITQLNPNLAVICLGMNDRTYSVTPSAYKANLATIVSRVLTAKPNCSILIFPPADAGTTKPYPISDYNDSARVFALENNYAYIDNYKLIGDYTTANARGLYANTTHLNETGGDVLVKNLLNYLMNGLDMQYNSTTNTNYGTSSFANAISTGSYNAAYGNNALRFNTSGYNNSAFGGYSLRLNTSGSFNSAMGFNALSSNTTGSNNVAQGYYALSGNTTASDNTGIGANALINSAGANNTSIGSSSLRSNLTGSNNVASGVSALQFNTTGYNNTANGYWALRQNVGGANNVAMGGNALTTNTTGVDNTGIGYASLQLNNTGSNNTGVGSNALNFCTTGSYNTAVGYGAAAKSNTASNLCALGYGALYSTTTGSNNTGFGYQAGFSNVSGIGNIFLGMQSGYYETRSNKFYVNNQARGNLGGDTTLSLMYGTMAPTTANQYLKVNATMSVSGTSTLTNLIDNGTFSVSGQSTLAAVRATGNMSITGTCSVGSTFQATGTMSITGASTLTGAVRASTLLTVVGAITGSANISSS